ncbi:hypothetical protein A2Y85_02380 [candidate division WOR-3 bacterium RBG_13_43_14]|uniref:Uncharacterized protein n=1 Tax=candidate division WOR-3 bacterium RBG_13_43_14 TaxID=1802590 RepID=A0A1F4UDT5_UNCW3|nr:MAG: hypothetical protein A2Y85_02380 [candidate division WOR-3 bacterium RBG_13_43_14]
MSLIIIALISFWDHSCETNAGIAYNNNIFAYSNEYIQDFMDQVRPYRFPFETYDDLELSQNISLLLRNKLINKHTTTFSIRSRIRHFLINKQKDYLSANLGIRQSFGKWAVKISYDLLPYYLIRYYRDPNGTGTDYAGCRVDYHEITGKVSISPSDKINFHFYYSRIDEKYHNPFAIYDAANNSGAVQLEQQVSPYLDLKLSYTFRASRTDTIGIDSIEDSPDASYDQHCPMLDIVYRRQMLLPVEIAIRYAYKFRNHLSDIPTDLLHFGRQDHIHDLNTSISFRLRTGMKFKCSFEQTWRNTTSTINNSIGQIKNYSQTKIDGALILYY